MNPASELIAKARAAIAALQEVVGSEHSFCMFDIDIDIDIDGATPMSACAVADGVVRLELRRS